MTKAQRAAAGRPHWHHRLAAAGETFAPGDLKGFETAPPSELYKSLKGTSQFEKRRQKKSLLLRVTPKWPAKAAHSESHVVLVSSPGHESAALPAHNAVWRGVNELSPHFTNSWINPGLISRSHPTRSQRSSKLMSQARKKEKKKSMCKMVMNTLHHGWVELLTSLCWT